MRLVLDTCIICRDYRMSGSTFRAFFDGLNRTGYSLHIPRVVYDEVVNRYGEQLRSARRKIEDAKRTVKGLTTQEFSCPITEADIETLEEEYKNLLSAKFAAVQARYLDYPRVSHREIIQRALKRKKPFDEKGKVGYRDTLIWESILELATNGSAEPIAFISSNHKDFADKDSNLHPDLLKDIASLGAQCSEVVLFKDLESFVDKQIKPTMETLEGIRCQLETGEFPQLSLRTFVEEELASFVGGVELDAMDLGLPTEFESISLSGIEEIYSVDEIDVRQLSTGELFISLSVDFAGEFDFFIFKADYYALPEEKEPFIWDPDWNEHYMAGSTGVGVRMKLDLVFDTDSNQVTSVQIIEALRRDEAYPPLVEQLRAIQGAPALYAQQLRAFQEALVRYPEQLGASQEALGRYPEQLRAFQEAVARYLEQLRASQEALGRYPEQLRAFQEAVARYPEQLRAIQNAIGDAVTAVSRFLEQANAYEPETGGTPSAETAEGVTGSETQQANNESKQADLGDK